MPRFGIEDGQFTYDGVPIQIISGSMHYFRIVPEYWEDRLVKLKACGFNTVETYIAWNVHEPIKGQFNFDGLADVERFIRMAGDLGLHVIVRPSPYICAEWEFGGLPAWLLSDPDMRLRCFHPPFLRHVDEYYDVLIPRLKPLLCTNGGPIIAVQIENEYGSYGNDKRYLNYLKEALVSRGVDVLLFTSDGPEDFMMQGGMLDGVLETVNFGSHPGEAFAKLRQYQPHGPLMCTEFWIGWFDHWGEQHHTRDAQDAARVLDDMLALGASVNFYMFHGGTNFGFYNGANHQEKYEPTVTSYDYDSLLNEAGEPTEKYHAVRDVISKYVRLPELDLPAPAPKKAYGEVLLTEHASLFDTLSSLSEPVARTCPEPMEQLGQNYGFILYTTQVSGPRDHGQLIIQDVHDRAIVFLDGKVQGVVERWNPGQSVPLSVPKEGARLSLLVENMGRVNYGPHLRDRKGITEGVRLDNQFLFDWTIYTLPLDDLSRVQYRSLREGSGEVLEGPRFYRGHFLVDVVADTFLALPGWTKGVVYINGFNLGRYWEIGPQKTLYVPGPLLRAGENEIVIFELHGTNAPVATFQDRHILG
ncbi:MAG: beta-galactosidase [Alicyclobacillus sp.]|nr:beta-galactosidase [Alicyclobacillus sp.]